MSSLDLEFRSYLASFLTDHRRDLLPRVIMNRTRHLTIAIEDVYTPHNASACLRSCDCFGIQDVHIIENQNEYQVNEEVALGASKWMTIHRYRDTTACLNSLKSQGYAIAMTSPHDADCSLETYDVRKPTVLVFGNEKDGVSPAVKACADHVMRIPMHGFTESFNISVAVAVTLHHLVWRMRESNVEWRLTPAEREIILTEWVRTASNGRLKALETRFEELHRTGQLPSQPIWPEWSTVCASVPAERANRRSLD